MSKILAILKELGTALGVPTDKLNSLIEGKEEKDIEEGEVTKLYNDAVRSKLDTISRNAAFDKKKVQDEAYKAAERKIKETLEATIKERFDLSDSSADNLDALIDDAVGKIVKAPGKKAADLTDDDVKKHPVYVLLEKRLQKEVKEAKDAGETAVNALKEQYEGEKVFGEVSDSALAAFKALNPVLPDDPKKAEGRLGLVKKLLGEYKYQKVENEIIILDKDGNVLEDELKNKIKLDAHVKTLTDPYFDFKIAEERKAPNGGSGGNGGNQGGEGSTMKYTGALPKSKQEVVKMVNDEKIPLEHRLEISDWADKNAASLTD